MVLCKGCYKVNEPCVRSIVIQIWLVNVPKVLIVSVVFPVCTSAPRGPVTAHLLSSSALRDSMCSAMCMKFGKSWLKRGGALTGALRGYNTALCVWRRGERNERRGSQEIGLIRMQFKMNTLRHQLLWLGKILMLYWNPDIRLAVVLLSYCNMAYEWSFPLYKGCITLRWSTYLSPHLLIQFT